MPNVPIDSSLAPLLEAARLATLRASEVCRFVQASLDQVRAITKDDKSPVTVADFAAQAVVAMTLHEQLGAGFHLIAEESSAFLREDAHESHLDAALHAARHVWPDVTAAALLDAIDLGSAADENAASEPASGFWTLDPIDGTKGFLRGHQYAVCLAYIMGSNPVVAALGCPNLPREFGAPLDHRDPQGCLYLASVSPTTLARTDCSLSGNAASEPITRQDRPRESHAAEHAGPVLVESFEPSHSRQEAAGAIMERVNAKRAAGGKPLVSPTVRIDSQCKYAVVARGQADVYLRLPSKRGYVEKIWDHASGALVASQAGCIVSDARGKPLDFSHGSELTQNRGIVVAPKWLHADVISVIAELGMSEEAPSR